MTHVSPPRAAPAPRLARRAGLLRSSDIRDLLRRADDPSVLSLAGGLPDPASLPLERIRLAVDRALRRTGGSGPVALQYGATEGLDDLRELVATGFVDHPGSGTAAEILVTTGSQQAIDLVARVMLDPGDLVAVEDPVYLGARQTLDAHGAELLGVPVDGGGLCVDVLADRLAGGARPRLVYVVPHHQNPSGATLTGERRAELAALAGHYGFVILEDDPYRALGTDGPPLPPIGMLAPDRTITVGSASKIVAPGLRIGWVRAPGRCRARSCSRSSPWTSTPRCSPSSWPPTSSPTTRS